MLFRQIVSYSLLVGTLSGLLLTLVQFWQVIPIIQSAEHFESKTVSTSTHEHAVHQETIDNKEIHEHSVGAWKPAKGVERTSFTLLSNVLSGIGFALVLMVLIVFSRKTKNEIKLDWWHGVLWGIAGYVVFFVAPSFGVPPKIPGVIAAPLEQRQLWWLIAVIFTAAGLAAAFFGKSLWRWTAVGLLVVPFLIGAPSAPTYVPDYQTPEVTAGLIELGQQFISATAIANAVFWVALGLVSVWTVKRIVSDKSKFTS